MNSKIICIDLEGTLAKNKMYDGSIAEPMEGAVEKCKLLVDCGYVLVVFTARTDLEVVTKWLADNKFPPSMYPTRIKIPALAYIDDRGIRFTNWEDIVKFFI